MGFTSADRYSSLFCLLELVPLQSHTSFRVQLLLYVSLLQVASCTGTCETVFKGFSDCLLSLGENMVNYPQELDDRENLRTICSYWDDFHSCASIAIADCQEGAVDLWEKLKVQSRSLNYKGSLFELCSGDNRASRLGLSWNLELTVLSIAVSKLLAWLMF